MLLFDYVPRSGQFLSVDKLLENAPLLGMRKNLPLYLLIAQNVKFFLMKQKL